MTPAGLTVVLVRPQLGENIGLVMRAMANFGVLNLSLVSPRDGWPSDAAHQASSGAHARVKARVFSTLPQALAPHTHTVAVTARMRDMKKTWVPFEKTPVQQALAGQGALVFGPEKAGLTNEDVSFCNKALSLPTSPAFPSLNLSHAVAVCLSLMAKATPVRPLTLAPTQQTHHFLDMLEGLLMDAGFFTPPEKAEKMRHNLRDLFLRVPLSKDDINTLFGVVHRLRQGGDKSK